MPKSITIEDITEGMIAAEPVINNYRQTLIPAGALLKEAHIKLLKTWSILNVTIISDAGDEKIELSDEVISLSKDRLSKRLKWKPDGPYEEAIYTMGINRAAQLVIKN